MCKRVANRRVGMNIILIFIVCLMQSCFSKLELQQVNVVFRHGDRTPQKKHIFPTDPYYGFDFHPTGYGRLTNTGKVRSFELGEFLRKRYDKFLDDVYFPNLLYARSSDYDRTKMSLQLVLAGLFPPSPEQIWHKSLDWQPIPTVYSPANQEDLLSIPCSLFRAEKNRVTMTRDMKSRIDGFTEFMFQLTNLTGMQITSSTEAKWVYLTLFYEQNMNLTLPAWSEEFFPYGKLLEVTLFDFETLTYDTKIKRSLNGKLISKITNDMLMVKNKRGIGTRDTRLFLYSGHDSNVNGILRSLNVYPTHAPFYSSAVIIEMLKEDEEYYVRVLYYHGNTTQIESLRMPGCFKLCPVHKYLADVNDLLS